LLHFARLNRVPMIALNIDRELVSKVGQQGWQSLDQEQRMGLSDPAPASEDYRRSLAQLYAATVAIMTLPMPISISMTFLRAKPLHISPMPS